MAHSEARSFDVAWLLQPYQDLTHSMDRSRTDTRYRASALLGLLIALSATGCSNPGGRSLVIYSPHGKEMLRAAEAAFESAHPDVDVQWIDMGGQNAYDRIRTERSNPQASLWWGGAGPTFSEAAENDLLEPFRPSWAGAVDSTAHDVADRWYATYLTPEVLLFNDRTVGPSDRPGDWDDLLGEEWKDRIIIRYPLASSTMRTIWGALIMRQSNEEEGYRWLARLDVNTKTYAADPTQLYLKIAREEGDVTLWNMPDSYIQTERNGYPFGFTLPASGTPVLNDAIALVRGAPNLDDARLFYEFVTSDSAVVDQANNFYRIPVRKDIDPALLPEWMTASEIRSMDVDWDRLATEGPRWMAYWDEHIKGRGAEYLRQED